MIAEIYGMLLTLEIPEIPEMPERPERPVTPEIPEMYGIHASLRKCVENASRRQTYLSDAKLVNVWIQISGIPDPNPDQRTPR